MNQREAFEKWFQGEQGVPYDGMWSFAWAAWQAATAMERESCAKVCEEATNGTNCHMIGHGFAEAIRDRK